MHAATGGTYLGQQSISTDDFLPTELWFSSGDAKIVSAFQWFAMGSTKEALDKGDILTAFQDLSFLEGS